MPPLPSTYKETELSEELNYGIEWVFRYYRSSVKQAKNPLPPRENVMKFNLRTNIK